jgi:hypothetical protein
MKRNWEMLSVCPRLSCLWSQTPLFFCQLTEKEAIKLDLEDLPVYEENLDALVSGCLEDFPEDAIQDDISLYAARIAQANITQGTRDGHIR